MSLELTEIISDLAKKKDSPFASILYDSLYAELTSRSTSLTTLICLLESISSWDDLNMYNLFLSYLIKQKKKFPDSSLLKSIVSEEENPSNLEKVMQDIRIKISVNSETHPPSMNLEHQNFTYKSSDTNHDQTSEVRGMPIKDLEAKDESKQILDTVYKTLSEELPDEKFKEVILTSVESYYEKYYSQLSLLCQKYIRQAHIYLNIALVFFCIGILVLFGRVFLSFALTPLLGTIITAFGIICVIVGTWAFTLNVKSREKLSNSIKEINTLTKFRAAKHYIDEITNSIKKDIALQKLLNNILVHEKT